MHTLVRIALLLALTSATVVAEPYHGVSVYGPENIELGPDEPFPYVNPDAPKGGRLNMRSSNFTKLNPYSLKGVAAPLLDLVFEEATVSSAADNEPGTAYGHLVKTIDVAEDHMSVTYALRPEARFSDGHPVTADDFVFSFELIDDPQYHPMYKQYFADIKACRALDRHTVRYEFATYNQELPLITGQIPILPEHVYGAEDKEFGADFDTVAVGSGPYVVERYEFGKFITLKRDPDWWGKDLPKSRGRYNFDTITAKVYLDEVSMKEAFKGGEFDVLWVSSSKDWALDFHGPFVERNYIARREIPHSRPIGMQGFAFNLRRPIFQSHKTRYAIAMVFNFQWSNENLFYNQYRRLRCWFENSPDLTNIDPPHGELKARMNALREKHGADAVPKTALYRRLHAPGAGKDPRTTMQQAEVLLESVGWEMGEDGVRQRKGERLSFELMVQDKNWERLAEPYQQRLRELGIEMTTSRVQPAAYQKRMRTFDFDMVVTVFGHSRSPGNEMMGYWSSEAAETEGSRNIIGIRNPAVDELLKQALRAPSRRELASRIHALDRILTCKTYVVPHWGLTYDRTLVWNKFGHPDLHASQVFFETCVRDYWWWDEHRVERLENSMNEGEALPEPEPVGVANNAGVTAP